jgi:GDP-L-fucose synthase
MADACVHLLEISEEKLEKAIGVNRPPLVNIGCGEDQTIAELAEKIREAVGTSVRIVYDRSKPDGTPQKLLDIGLIRSLGWQPRLSLTEGLRSTYAAFLKK